MLLWSRSLLEKYAKKLLNNFIDDLAKEIKRRWVTEGERACFQS